MAFPGETIHLGAPDTCPDCGEKLKLEVLRSGAGYYIGTYCCNQPMTRESYDYYPSREAAQLELDNDTWERR